MLTLANLKVDDMRSRQLIAALRLAAIFILIFGVVAASLAGVPYWVDRSGKVIVIVSLLATYVQFLLEDHHEKTFTSRMEIVRNDVLSRGMPVQDSETTIWRIADDAKKKYHETRRRVFSNAIVIAIFGEAVAAFGGIVFLTVTSFI